MIYVVVVVVVVEYLIVRLEKNCVNKDFFANGTFDDDVVDDEHDDDEHELLFALIFVNKYS
jgi:hypothetical protein